MGIFGKKTPVVAPKKAPQPPVKSTAGAAASPAKGKARIFAGLTLIFLASLCVVVVFYFLINSQRAQESQIDELSLEVEALNTEKEVADAKIADLHQEIKRSPDLQKIVAAARQEYGPDESQRREGTLWVDRKGVSLIVTLGALNGLAPGTRLSVYDGDTLVGSLKVDLPLDVISTTLPEGFTIKDLTKDYYRVVMENK